MNITGALATQPTGGQNVPLLTTLLTWRTVTKGLNDPRLLAVDWFETPQESLASCCGFSPDNAS